MTVKAASEMREKQIVIIGGGAIGVCTAYYLTRHPSYDPEKHKITLLEATRIAGGASGKAAGCLGEWAEPRCIAKASWRLHNDLAQEYDGVSNWGFRRVASADCDLVHVHPDDEHPGEPDDEDDGKEPVVHSPQDVDWVKQDKFKWFKPEGSTAQIMPFEFVSKLSALAYASGVKLVLGRAESIKLSQDKEAVQSVSFSTSDSTEEQHLLASDVVVAAGPWTNKVLPEAPIRGELSTAIIVQPQREISGVLLFFDPGNLDANNPNSQLEIYPRPDKTVYMSGSPVADLKLPDSTDDVHPDPARVKGIHEKCGIVSDALSHSKLLKSQACFRPVVDIDDWDIEGSALIGPTGIRGLLLAAGHNHWGIQNSPISGKVMSELIFDGQAKSADISSLDPRKHLRFSSKP